VVIKSILIYISSWYLACRLMCRMNVRRPQVMLKFVDPRWYQQPPNVQATLIPVRE